MNAQHSVTRADRDIVTREYRDDTQLHRYRSAHINDDRYRYVIELGRTLRPMPEAEHSAENKVNGCVSQVWLSRQIDRSGNGEPRLKYLGDSDAHIVRGLIAILLTLYSGRTPQQILSTDALAVFDEFGFRDHLTPQRSNGLRSMVERIRSDARETLAAAS